MYEYMRKQLIWKFRYNPTIFENLNTDLLRYDNMWYNFCMLDYMRFIYRGLCAYVFFNDYRKKKTGTCDNDFYRELVCSPKLRDIPQADQVHASDCNTKSRM